jgi:hypothetical protein
MIMRFALPIALVCLCASAVAQQIPITSALPPREIQKNPGMKFVKDHAQFFFNTNVGSFKLLGVNEIPVEGTFDMSFKGTVLISNLDPQSTFMITGNVRKEIDDKKLGKTVYFGTGRITIYGKFRAIQFFGQDLRARFDGFGFIRMYGEFDKNLDTGYFWYGGDSEPTAWSNSGIGLPIPQSNAQKPKVKIEGKGT